MTKRISKSEIEERGLNTDVIVKRTDANEPLPPASVEATSKVVHAYVPPPVIDLQDKVFVPGRKPLPAELESFRKAETDSRTAVVEALQVEIKRDFHKGYSDHITTAEDTERAHNASLNQVRADMARQKQTESMAVIQARESNSHQANVDLILSEMAGTIRTDDYSGGFVKEIVRSE